MTTEKYDLIISGGIIAGPEGTQKGDIAIKDERFAAIGDLADAEADERHRVAERACRHCQDTLEDVPQDGDDGKPKTAKKQRPAPGAHVGLPPKALF